MTAPIDTAELRQLLSNPGKGSWVSAVLEKQSTADAIVAVVNAAPALLDELDALRAENEMKVAQLRRAYQDNERLRADLREYRNACEQKQEQIDSLRRFWDDCDPYLKEGESPADALERNRGDLSSTLELLAKERAALAAVDRLMKGTP